MQNLDTPDFLAHLADDEKLIGLAAYHHGLHHALRYLLDRLDSFYSLLELELEDSPAGQTYVEQGAIPLSRAAELLSIGAFVPRAVLDAGFETFDLRVLLRGMAQRITKVGLAQIHLSLDEAGGDLLVTGDLTLLQQMIFAVPYLFGNDPNILAANFTISVEPVTVDDEFRAAHTTPLKAGSYYAVTFRVDDTGGGQHQALVERLGASKDLGLNPRLVLCLGVALHHNGDLFTVTGAGELDELTWYIPVSTPASPGYEGRADADLQGTGTIMLVDDEDIIWDVVIDMLQDAGYTVILAANGRDCVEIYRDNPGEIDLVLLDMVMPEMNGHQAFFALKEIDPDVKVLLHSGYVAEEDAREVLDAGACGFLQKPYRMATLASKIRDILATNGA